MPQNITKQEINDGRVVYEWEVREYEKYDRDSRWYWIMGLIALALVAYGIISGNYLFALVIILFGIILFMHEMQEPLKVRFAVTETGIILGEKYYKFSELGNFWLIYNPPDVKNLYFKLNNFFKHRLQVPLLDYDPRPIRDYNKV